MEVPHAGGADVHADKPSLQLVLLHDASGARRRPAPLLAPRKGVGWVVFAQRDGVRARTRRRLRPVAAGGRHRLVVRRLPAVLPPLADARVRSGRLPWRGRAAEGVAWPHRQPAARRLRASRSGGRVPPHGRLQRVPAGGVRGVRHDDLGGATQQHGGRLPTSGALPRQPHRPQPRPRYTHHLRRDRRRRRRVPAGWRHQAGVRRTRGDRERRRDQLAAAPPAVGRRQHERPEAARHPGGGAPAGRRAQPAGPPGGVRAAALQAAGHPLPAPVALPADDDPDGRRVVPARHRRRRHRSPRDGRLRAQRAGRRPPRRPVPLPPGRRARPRAEDGRLPRVPGACRSAAAHQCRSAHPRFPRSHPASRHRTQLPLDGAGPEGVPRVCAARARGVRAEGVRRVPRLGAGARRRRSDGRRTGRVRARPIRLRLPPVVHVSHGPAVGRGGRGRPRVSRDRRRPTARRRRVVYAEHRQREPQRTDHHAGGEGGRHDPGRAPIVTLRRPRVATRHT